MKRKRNIILGITSVVFVFGVILLIFNMYNKKESETKKNNEEQTEKEDTESIIYNLTGIEGIDYNIVEYSENKSTTFKRVVINFSVEFGNESENVFLQCLKEWGYKDVIICYDDMDFHDEVVYTHKREFEKNSNLNPSGFNMIADGEHGEVEMYYSLEDDRIIAYFSYEESGCTIEEQ